MECCGTCKYIGKNLFRITGNLFCLNEDNRIKYGQLFCIPNLFYCCKNYKAFNLKDKFEWDESKNVSNKKKHNLGFELALEIYNDPFHLRVVQTPDKWEKIDESKFDKFEIEPNIGNSDPVRGKIIGKVGSKIYTFVYTFRHNLGELAIRVISLRIANNSEVKSYNSFYNYRINKK